MRDDDPDLVRVDGSTHLLTALSVDDLMAVAEALERRVTSATATLADFGALDRARRELARRAEECRSA